MTRKAKIKLEGRLLIGGPNPNMARQRPGSVTARVRREFVQRRYRGTRHELAKRLGIDEEKVRKAIDYLVQRREVQRLEQTATYGARLPQGKV